MRRFIALRPSSLTRLAWVIMLSTTPGLVSAQAAPAKEKVKKDKV